MKKIKDEVVGSKKEIKKMIKEVIREEMGNFKQDLEVLKKWYKGKYMDQTEDIQRSYNEAIKDKKKKI